MQDHGVYLALIAALFVALCALGGLALRRLRAQNARAASALQAARDAEMARNADAARSAEAARDAKLARLEKPPAATVPPASTDLAAQPAPKPAAAPAATSAEPAPKPPVPPAAAPADDALRAGLQRTQGGFLQRINSLFGGGTQVDAATLDALEDVLLGADVGVQLTMRLMDRLRENKQLRTAQAVRDALRQELLQALQAAPPGTDLNVIPQRPKVVLFVGVNGVGKTTSIGKIAAQLRGAGRSVLLAAGDTFRAAAAEQLAIWSERSGATLERGQEGADPASVIFAAVQRATRDKTDVVLCDTAGRLHTKVELMDEIKKVQRAAGKARSGAPDETWLVVDATTGQNALQQAREFHAALGLTGIVLTKLDGTAKGGVVVALVEALRCPVRFVGVGERAEDLRPFAGERFIAALFDDARSAAA